MILTAQMKQLLAFQEQAGISFFVIQPGMIRKQALLTLHSLCFNQILIESIWNS